jgi:hypothetical protein
LRVVGVVLSFSMTTKKPREKKLTVKLTQKQAEMLGIVRCTCGHPINNHFDFSSNGFKRPCAHCTCKAYTQIVCLPVER